MEMNYMGICPYDKEMVCDYAENGFCKQYNTSNLKELEEKCFPVKVSIGKWIW